MMDKKQIIGYVKAIFFPDRCVFCDRVQPPLIKTCDDCEAGIERIKDPVCIYCGCCKNVCICKKKKSYFDGIFAPFYYKNQVKKSLHRFKFKGRTEYAQIYANAMADCLRSNIKDKRFDCIVTVPLTESDKKTRGYNQSNIIAEELSRELEIVFMPEVLLKIYETKKQHSLPEYLRKGNVFGVYDVNESADVKGKTILLCDDIKTTGYTLNECAKMLKLKEAAEVWCVVCALTCRD